MNLKCVFCALTGLLMAVLVMTLSACGSGYNTSNYSPTPYQGCTVAQSDGSVSITCPNGTVTIPSVTIQPICPNSTGAYYSGSYGSVGFLEYYIGIGKNKYAVIDAGHGNNTDDYLTLLLPGNYVTSDNTGCNFTVSSNGLITVN